MATTSTPAPVTALFLDVGGVMLTNGWDRKAREAAAKQFGLDLDDLNDRHRMTFDTYETGKLSLEEYLKSSVFYKDRPFTLEEFRTFMFDQSVPYQETIDLIKALKAKYKLRIAVVNNEGRELNEHRIRTYKLNEFVDSLSLPALYISGNLMRTSGKLRWISRRCPGKKWYTSMNRPMFVQVAQGLGLRGVPSQPQECGADKRNTGGMGLKLD